MLEIEQAQVRGDLFYLLCIQSDKTLAQIPGFERDPLLVTKHAVNQQAGVVDSYKHDAPGICKSTVRILLAHHFP